jgi:hypothetical protein
MKPLERAYVPQSEHEIVIADLIRKWADGNPEIRGYFPAASQREASAAIRTTVMEMSKDEETWRNEKYQVSVRRSDKGLVHLSIKLNTREVVKDWRDFQAIKNQLVGEECEGVELYPASSRLVDTSNQYHIWAVADPTFRFPFGFSERFVTEDTLGKSQQRKFEHEETTTQSQ